MFNQRKKAKTKFFKAKLAKEYHKINQFPLLVIIDFPQCKKIRRDEKYISDVIETYSV